MSVFQSVFLSPSNIAIPATATNNYECEIRTNTKADKYKIVIRKVSDNTVVKDTGDIVLSPVLYNGDKLTVPLLVNTLVNGTEYKWDITTYDGAQSATSIQSVFKCNSLASLSSTIPSTITSQSYDFTFVYSQSENIPLKYHSFIYYDVNNNIIKQTDNDYSGRLTNKFNGFISGSTYSIKCIGETQNNVLVESPKYTFSVSYSKPNINITPVINQDKNTSIVEFIIGELVQITATSSGTYSYLQNYGITDNVALQLDSGSWIQYPLNVPIGFNCSFMINLTNFTVGKFIEFIGLDGNYEIGYDGNRFYYNNKGTLAYSIPITKPTIDIVVNVKGTDVSIVINNVMYKIDII